MERSRTNHDLLVLSWEGECRVKGEWKPRRKLIPMPWFLVGYLDG